ncbi:MAG: hypothetical protein WC574_05630 [Candidatus Omnitrophota bacterium]|jgi:rubrerythrin
MIDIEVLRIALAKEENAIKLYKKLLRDHPALKDLLYFLITEEQKHKKLIQNKIIELTR